MLIDYITNAMDEKDFNTLFKGRSFVPGQQVQKYNRLLIEGLGKNQIPVHVVSCRPVTPATCTKKYLPRTQTQRGNILWDYVSVVNIPVLKVIWQMFRAYHMVNKDARQTDCAVVFDVLNASAAYGACLAAKKNKIPCIGIVTDFPDMMSQNPNRRYAKLVYKVIEMCTGYILLTEQMNDKINPTHKPYVIVEGLCDEQMRTQDKEMPAKQEIKKCIYAGLLDERYGVKTMVEGFIRAAMPNAQLHLYGNGSYTEELKQLVKSHSQIVYHGTVLNQEVVKAELEAALLINPRPTTEEFTKYSFPSKNMEYMVSGTPVLTTNLPGMPAEYRPYVYLISDESVEGLCSAFQTVLALPAEELYQKGVAAKQFVLEKKNNVAQAQKAIHLIQKQL